MIEPVKVLSFTAADNAVKVSVLNRYDFISLDHLNITWKMEKDGKWIAGGAVPAPTIAAGKTGELTIPTNHQSSLAGGECIMTILFSLAADTAWAKGGARNCLGSIHLPDK